MTSDEAVEAAAREFYGDAFNEASGDKLQYIREKMRELLEAAAPHMLADHLLTLAEDTRARGDIGKDGGCEAWDYLTFHAEKARANPHRSQA